MEPVWGSQLWCCGLCLGVFLRFETPRTPQVTLHSSADHHPPEKLAWVLLAYWSVQPFGILARRVLPTPAPNRAKVWGLFWGQQKSERS